MSNLESGPQGPNCLHGFLSRRKDGGPITLKGVAVRDNRLIIKELYTFNPPEKGLGTISTSIPYSWLIENLGKHCFFWFIFFDRSSNYVDVLTKVKEPDGSYPPELFSEV